MVLEKQSFTMGFVGFGEAAFAIATGLRDEGFDRMRAYDATQCVEPNATIIQDRASELGVPLDPSLEALIANSDIIFVATSSASAVPVAEESAPFLSCGKLYVDANAAAPDAMVRVSQLISRSGSSFVDVAMMGPLPRYCHKVPILACGDGAALFETCMTPLKMNVRTVGTLPGKASAIKCFRSIYMKGAAALLFETCLAARRYEAVELIVESLSESFDSVPFKTWVDRLLNGTAIHAGRRIHEMDDVVGTLKTLGVESTMSEATRDVLSWVNTMGLPALFEGKAPDDYSDVLAAIEEELRSRDK